ncbi:restriction endonuclease subunit S [Pseudomonas sp. TH49]|uniref:Restriction endonuclease S subunit n=1 Tax=Pseudomonas fluorescens R124 TaxID=743713 RepID=A0A7U9CVH0_PSEFL|nr:MULTISPECIES: restriction endonuclease subunit S [Pseudomonas]EJZ60245.1 Restriction endonuclease S subunit [Pseudomonas fluorescens R124]MBK5341848.1 restriction endonuclease subunit S [Pseudomonas sp. TH49]
MIKNIKLSSIAKISLGHTFREKAEAVTSTSGVRLVQIKDVREGVLEDIEQLPFADVDPEKLKIHLALNDVLLPLRGNRSEAMIYSVSDPKILVTTTNQVAIIKSIDKSVIPAYFHWYFNSSFGRKALESIRGGATIPNISIKNLYEVEVPVPSVEEQVEILRVYSSWSKQKAVLQELLTNGESLMASLCAQIMGVGNGK